MHITYFMLIGFLLLHACKTQNSDPEKKPETVEVKNSIEILDVATFKSEITTKKVQLIDVRTPEEFVEGHIAYAKNVDFLAEDFSKAILNVNKDEPVYIYCRSGNRSGQAALLMKKLGYKTIYDLSGGYMAWEDQD